MTEINNFNADEKILQYQDKLYNYCHGHETLVSFELDLTNKCNNRCPRCVGVKEGGAELSLEQILSIVEQAKELNVKSVVISGGGEPLLSPYFVETLYAFRDAGISIGLNSNGLALITDKLKFAILTCCDYFRISLDGGIPEVYKITHGMEEEVFWHVIDNIQTLMMMRGSVNSETSIGLGYLVGDSTMHGIMDFFKLSNELHVDFAQLRPFTNEYSDPSLYISEGKRRYPNLNITSSSHKFSHMKDNNKQPYDICHGMYFNTVITADFKMWSCIHHRQNIDYYLGNLSNTTIKEILKSSHMKHIQNKVPNKDCPLFCRNDAINRTLNSICKNVVHKEFL